MTLAIGVVKCAIPIIVVFQIKVVQLRMTLEISLVGHVDELLGLRSFNISLTFGQNSLIIKRHIFQVRFCPVHLSVVIDDLHHA